jgi:hypothetical protein
MRRVCWLAAWVAIAAGPGCSRSAPRPGNPILENAQANLQGVEARFRALSAPAPADYLALGTARYQVWTIYLARSRFRAGTAAARRKTAENRRQAERLLPAVIEAYAHAAEGADARAAAMAKARLVLVYGEVPDLDKQIVLLRQILRDHGGMKDPAVFGLGEGPQYYCYYTLAGAYEAKGERALAIDAMARALMALDARDRAGADSGPLPARLLGRLVDYEPRVVLPRYQRLLPASLDESSSGPNFPNRTGPAPALERILRTYREAAPTRIMLAISHTDHNGLVVDYQVVCPAYAGIMETWRKEQENPRPRLGDDFSGTWPRLRLSFATLPTAECFSMAGPALAALAPATSTGPLAFGQDGRAVGKMVLKWSDRAPWKDSLYLVARLERNGAGMGGYGPAFPAQDVYVEPVELTFDRTGW